MDRRMTNGRKRALGAVMTPAWLADVLVAEAVGRARARFGGGPLAALDPACGDGQLTLARARAGLRAERICGVDVDGAAIGRATARHGRAKPDFRVGDALVDGPGVPGVTPLEWHRAFPEVMAAGGFHLVVGNPPYRSIDTALPGEDPSRHAAYKRYLQTFACDDSTRLSWRPLYRRMADIYHLFFHRALWLLRPGGVLAFLTSRTWLEAHYADALRIRLARETTVAHVHDFGDRRVFPDAAIPAAIVVLERTPPASDHRVRVTFEDGTALSVPQRDLGAAPWRFRGGALPTGLRLGDLCTLGQGAQTGANEVFAELSAADVAALQLETGVLRRRAVGSDIRSDRLADDRLRFAVWTHGLAEADLPPRTRAYLAGHRARLEGRAAFRRGDCAWYGWTWPRPQQMGLPKILCPYRAIENRFWYDPTGDVVGLTDTTVLVPHPDASLSPEALVARLNTPEMTARQQRLAKRTGGGLLEYFASQLAELPIG